MQKINALDLGSQILGRIRRIKTRTWVMLGLFVTACFALAIWAVIAFFGAIWGGAQNLLGTAPATIEAAKQKAQILTDAAKEHVAQQLPQIPTSGDVKAEFEKHAEALTQSAREQLAQNVPDVQQAIEQAKQLKADAQAKAEQTAVAIASSAAAAAVLTDVVATAEKPLARDVSGEDLGPTRYPGMVRMSWVATETGAQVRYEGRVDYASVISHYQREFTALGFTQSVVSANANQEVLRFSKDSEELTVNIERAGLIVTVGVSERR